jgi:hypothetical protein
MALLSEAQRIDPEASSSQALVRSQSIALALPRSEQPRSVLHQPCEEAMGDGDPFLDPFF